jgi:voltage-gated potassium channel
MATTLRARVHTLLEQSERPSVGRRLVSGVLMTVIIGSAAANTLETISWLAAATGRLAQAIEVVALAILAVEYLLRLWTAPEADPRGAERPWRARLRYAVSFLGLVDLLSIEPVLLPLALGIPDDWMRVIRLLRLFKLARYTPALPLFVAVIKNEWRPLLATLFVVLVLLVFQSSIMYTIEREAQPAAFGSIPDAMWWAIVTIATVGYGDVHPVTPPGKMFASVVMILSIAVFALPAGILATGFASELRKRDFIVTWNTVASVPLFAGLDASRIAEIARLLKRHVLPPHHAVVQRGEPADAMFFIMAGDVLVDVEPKPIRLGRGQFFGEIALLRDTVRTATITTVTECQLLSLDVTDFRRLLATNPRLRATVTRVADERVAMWAGAEVAGASEFPT